MTQDPSTESTTGAPPDASGSQTAAGSSDKPEAVSVAPATSLGPTDVDSAMTETELWKRAETAHLQHIKDEVDRASEYAAQMGYGDLITVMSARNDDRVAFSEVDQAHPGGHAYVAGRDSPPQIIGDTPAAEQALLDHQIKKVEAK